MLPPPVGFTPLKAALDLLRAKLPAGADAEREIAEACHRKTLCAAYRTWDGGAEDLDPKIWRQSNWRCFFELGTIDLELPMIDPQGKPVPDGRKVKGCTREIFVESDMLVAFLKSLPAPPTADVPRVRRGPKAGTMDRVVADMQSELLAGKLTVDDLQRQSEKSLATKYGVSRDTVRKARTKATSGAESKPRVK